MPGLVGLVTRMPRARAEAELGRMMGTMRHAAFYRTGTCIHESMGLYLGWCEREDLSGGKPRTNEAGDLILAFSGEDVSKPGIQQVRRDPAFLAELNGRFHGVLVDRSHRTITLFNDRYGMHRVYYHQANDAFYFAAEAKAILAVRPETRAIDLKGLGEFVACGCVLEDRTLFNGIHVLPSASAWVFRSGVLAERKKYFEPREWEEQSLLDPATYYRELRDAFSQNLDRHFGGPQPVAMSLTGGLDTRMITAWHKPAAGSLPCFTFGGTYRDCRDVVVARDVARLWGQSHDVIEVGQPFLARFASYAERTVHLSDGCADVSRSADLYVNERAREFAPVRMTGNYGGEVLRQVRAFKPSAPLAGLFSPELIDHVDRAKGTYARLLHGHPLSFAVFRQAPWHHYGLLALEQTQVSMRSPFLDNDFIRTVFRAPESARSSNAVCLRLIADGNPAMRRILTDRGLGAGRWDLSGSAARQIQQFLFKAEYAYDYGMPQWLAPIDRQLTTLRPERLFLGRHKFYHYRIWYRDALSRYIREMLLDPTTLSRPYVERRMVQAVVDGHLKGHRNYTTSIHKLLTIELLHRLFIDSARQPLQVPVAPQLLTPEYAEAALQRRA